MTMSDFVPHGRVRLIDRLTLAAATHLDAFLKI